MPTTVYIPTSDRPVPLILVLHTSGGLRQGEHEFAQALMREGFLAVVPDFYTPYGITVKKKKLTWTKYQKAIFDDLVMIISQINQMQKKPSKKTFAVGFSNGGYWASVLAATSSINAGVSYYGAYTEGGTCRKPELESCSILSAANSNSSPLLMIHGRNDKVVKLFLAVAFENLYRSNVGANKLQVEYYADVNHAFNLKYNYKGKYYNPDVSARAWKRTLKFLGHFLTEPIQSK